MLFSLLELSGRVMEMILVYDLLCQVVVHYFSDYSLVSVTGAVFWIILAGFLVVLWNSSVFSSPRYFDAGICGCSNCSLWLVRYATFVYDKNVSALKVFVKTCNLL
jgi:hypothetical protein